MGSVKSGELYRDAEAEHGSVPHASDCISMKESNQSISSLPKYETRKLEYECSRAHRFTDRYSRQRSMCCCVMGVLLN